MKVKSFEDLTVWQEAHQLTLEVYKLTAAFPGSEKYGITSQMRRCSSAIPANIAEGFGRATTRELLRCLQIARAVGRLINALGNSLKKRLGRTLGVESPVTSH